MKTDRLNDDERSQWIDNDEGLYNWWKSARRQTLNPFSGLVRDAGQMPKREFIRQNREEIDRAINNVLNGSKPAHYLAYGGGR